MAHSEPNTDRRCRQCGVHHYACETCGADCTVGQPAGPCTQAIDGKHRCHECHRAWQVYLASATPTTEAEVQCIREALRHMQHMRILAFADVRDRLLAAIPAAPPRALAKGGAIDS